MSRGCLCGLGGRLGGCELGGLRQLEKLSGEGSAQIAVRTFQHRAVLASCLQLALSSRWEDSFLPLALHFLEEACPLMAILLEDQSWSLERRLGSLEVERVALGFDLSELEQEHLKTKRISATKPFIVEV